MWPLSPTPLVLGLGGLSPFRPWRRTWNRIKINYWRNVLDENVDGDGDGDGGDGDGDYGDGDGDVANLSVTGGDKNRVRGKGEASTLCAKLRLGECILWKKEQDVEDDIYEIGVMKVKVSR